MPLTRFRPATPLRSGAETWTAIGLAGVVAFFLISGLVAYLNIRALQADNQKIYHSHDVLAALDELVSTAQDAETGQRGFLLTGSEKYLEPYDAAVGAAAIRLDAVAALTADNPVQQVNIIQLRRHLDAKLAELRETIALRRTKGIEAALAVVATDRGKIEMDAIRAQAKVMRQEEQRLRELRLAEMAVAFRTAQVSGVVAALLGAVITVIVLILIRRSSAARARQEWLQAGQVGLAEAMLGDKNVEQLSDAVLGFMARYLGVQAGALFQGEGDRFSRAATLGVPADAEIPLGFRLREGLLGQVAADGQAVIVRDVPEGYLAIGSALGQDKPRHLAIVPVRADGAVNGVIELGFLHPVDDRILDLLQQASGAIGVALRSALYRTALQNLLEETQRQSEELQTQSEELRVSNEELEEQGRALKESQVRLEQQ